MTYRSNANEFSQDFALPIDIEHRDEILAILNSCTTLDSEHDRADWLFSTIEEIIQFAQPMWLHSEMPALPVWGDCMAGCIGSVHRG